MKSTVKLVVTLAIIIGLHSCNVSKYYANMRIDHDDEILNEKPAKPIGKIIENSTPFNATIDSLTSIIPVTNETKTARSNKSLEKINSKRQTDIQKKQERKTYYVHVKKKTIFTAHKSKRKIRKNQLSATKTFDDMLSGIIVCGLLLGVVVAIVSGSIGTGFLVALGIVLLVLLGVAIAIGAIVWFVFELLFATFWK